MYFEMFLAGETHNNFIKSHNIIGGSETKCQYN
jgi:hypothetical protein